MILERTFIDSVVQSFHNSLRNDGKLCDISGVYPDINIYGDHRYQKLYALKYIPAYYFEYCVMADILNARARDAGDKELNVVSLGCGLTPDYYALKHNLSCQFEYHGYDAYNWTQRALMPSVGSNYRFYNTPVSVINSSDVSNADVFIFPKSIGDIFSSDETSIDHLADVISRTDKKRLYFLNSFVSDGKRKNRVHIGYFRKIHDELLKVGFLTNDDPDATFHYGELGCGLNKIHRNFVYDTAFCIKCMVPGCTDTCRCNVNKTPILTNRFMDYQVMEYFK